MMDDYREVKGTMVDRVCGWCKSEREMYVYGDAQTFEVGRMYDFKKKEGRRSGCFVSRAL
jgi:hypothetical protein